MQQRFALIATLKLLLVPLLLLGAILITPDRAEALSGSDFNAGNIIDDGVFFNSTTMDESQVQNFLNSKVPSCDTLGTKWHSASNQTRAQYGAANGNPAPYTCLRDYKQNTPSMPSESGLCNSYFGGSSRSAAEIIVGVSKACGINPQTLIVLLQKEQSLITDDWPWSNQYNKATGFGCPDTAPCDSSYGGFFYQIYYAARQFKKYARDATQYSYRAGRDNRVYWQTNLGNFINPSGNSNDPSRTNQAGCGYTNVYIQNQSTAGLYVYTPYQPNGSALSNLYGEGDSCSAYGNRNFWRMFTDWFGSTHGAIIRSYESGDLYLYDGTQRYYIPSLGQLNEYGFDTSYVRFYSQAELNSIPIASAPYSNRLDRIIKSPSSGDLYLLDRSQRVKITSMSLFESLGYTTSMITVMPDYFVNNFPVSANSISTIVQAPDNSIYKIELQKKRAIFEISKMNELIGASPVTPLSSFNLSLWQFGTPLVDGNYLVNSSGAIRLYYGEFFYSVSDMDTYDCWNLGSIKTFSVGFSVTNGTSKGSLRCVAQSTNGERFLISQNKKYILPSSPNLGSVLMHDAMLSRYSSSPTPLVIMHPNGDLATLRDNKRRPIYSMADFSKNGYTDSDIVRITKGSFNSIPLGARDIPVGTFATDKNGNGYVIDSSSSRLYVADMSTSSAYGFNWTKAATIGDAENTAYPKMGTLKTLAKLDNNYYLVDGGKKLLVDSSAGMNTSSFQENKAIQPLPQATLTKFVMSSSAPTVYYLNNGKLLPINSWDKYLQLSGNGTTPITTISTFGLSQFVIGAPA